jgi:signal transduction protein with GAF and PtsI domain
LKTLVPEDVLTAEEHSSAREMIGRFADGRVVHCEWRLRRKDGSVFTGEVAGRRLPDGRIQIVVRDVTERRETEAAQRRLHELAMLRLARADVKTMLEAVLDAAIAITHADFGTIQLLDAKSSQLQIAAQRGFPDWWIAYWQHVDKGHGTCGTALGLGRRAIVEDVERSPIFSAADLDVQRRAGVRAVQSTPLISRSGNPLGVLSTYFKTPCRPVDRTLQMIDLLAHVAAEIIEHAQAEADLTRQADMLDLVPSRYFRARSRGPHYLLERGCGPVLRLE